MIGFTIEETDGKVAPVSVPDGIQLNLMEVLKASGYPIAATCGGMALCATCLVEVTVGGDRLYAPGEAELDILDTLPDLVEKARLSCQIPINDNINGCCFKMIL